MSDLQIIFPLRDLTFLPYSKVHISFAGLNPLVLNKLVRIQKASYYIITKIGDMSPQPLSNNQRKHRC